MLIRPETTRDYDAIYAVNTSAFDTPIEANLVAALREQAAPIVSLVADDRGTVIGHIMFSPVSLTGNPDLNLMGLAPMAVLREQQRQGVGSALIQAGLEHCRQLSVDAVAVLGHVEYYPRFGFARSSVFGIRSEFDVPDEAFMMLELNTNVLAGKNGTIRYHPAFVDV